MLAGATFMSSATLAYSAFDVRTVSQSYSEILPYTSINDSGTLRVRYHDGSTPTDVLGVFVTSASQGKYTPNVDYSNGTQSFRSRWNIFVTAKQWIPHVLPNALPMLVGSVSYCHQGEIPEGIDELEAQRSDDRSAFWRSISADYDDLPTVEYNTVYVTIRNSLMSTVETFAYTETCAFELDSY